MSDILEQMMGLAQEALQHPLALPIGVGIVTVLLTVLIFFSVSSSAGKKAKKRKTTKADAPSGGTTVVGGVRRSTRHVKWMSPAPTGGFVRTTHPTNKIK